MPLILGLILSKNSDFIFTKQCIQNVRDFFLSLILKSAKINIYIYYNCYRPYLHQPITAEKLHSWRHYLLSFDSTSSLTVLEISNFWQVPEPGLEFTILCQHPSAVQSVVNQQIVPSSKNRKWSFYRRQ